MLAEAFIIAVCGFAVGVLVGNAMAMRLLYRMRRAWRRAHDVNECLLDAVRARSAFHGITITKHGKDGDSEELCETLERIKGRINEVTT